MPKLMITKERNRGGTVDLAEERVFEDYLLEPISAVCRTKFLKPVSRGVIVCDYLEPGRRVKRIHTFGRFYTQQSGRHDGSRNELPQETDVLWRIGELRLKLFDHPVFNQTQVMHYLRNAPVVVGRAL